ncbi:hypothetical protein CK203_025070, partial [Vitis vinifera]
ALFLGHQRREPSSRVLESHPTHLSRATYRGPRIPGYPRDRYQASHDSRTTDRGQLGLQRSILPLETYFDIEALRQQPELEIHSDCCRDGRQGAIGARHIAEALRIPYEPVIQADFREWSSFSQSDMVRILSRGTSTASHKVQRRGAILEALFRISEGYFFGPHHLIMTSLLHFEEKVHQKKLQRADGIPLLFPRLLCQILEHLGYPEEPRSPAVPAPPELPRDEQLPQAQQDEILTETTPPPLQHPPQCTCPRLYILLSLSLRRLSAFIADTEHCSGFYYPPDGHYSCTPGSDHCYSGPAYHDPSSDSAASEYADSFGHDRSAPSEPLVPDEESLPAEQPIPEEEIRAEPSHDPTHI